MSDKSKGIVICTLDIIIVLLVCSIFLIIPSVKNIKELVNTKELTKEEKDALIEKVNNEYSTKLVSVNNKYSDKEKTINDKYDPLISEVNSKYDVLINDVKAKYKSEQDVLNDKLSTKNSEANKEFMKSGFSKKYYTLNDEVNSIKSEIKELNDKLNLEVNNLENEKKKDVTPHVINKNSLIKQNNLNKDQELSDLEVSKNKEINKINKNINNTNRVILESLKIVLAIVICIIPVLYIIKIYNKLTRLSNDVLNSYSNVMVNLKRRSDLIPNIVSAVKGYQMHEKNTLKEVVNARNKVVKSTNKDEEILNNMILDNEVRKIFVLNEKYPELKSDKSFNKLIDELKSIESDISVSRSEYNECVLRYTNVQEVFPSNLVSNVFSFKKESFYEDSKEIENNVKVGEML